MSCNNNKTTQQQPKQFIRKIIETLFILRRLQHKQHNNNQNNSFAKLICPRYRRTVQQVLDSIRTIFPFPLQYLKKRTLCVNNEIFRCRLLVLELANEQQFVVFISDVFWIEFVQFLPYKYNLPQLVSRKSETKITSLQIHRVT